jgi:hypothetical protein
MVPAGTENLIKARASEIKAAVTEFNARSRTKIVVGKENPFPVGEQAIYSLDVMVNGHGYSFCGCRTMPSMVVSKDADGKPKFVEFLDEFLETLQ